MQSFHTYYMIVWISACLIALGLIVRYRQSIAFLRIEYVRFLFKPWKVVTFLIATTAMTVAAPYSDDPTWDYFDSIAISTMTFLTAPWVMGAIWRCGTGRLPWAQAFVALCIMMFVPCWFYDMYILFRDGIYPETWLPNIPLSGSIYVLAGLFWNLDWRENEGVNFAFRWDDWPQGDGGSGFSRVIWYAVPFVVFVGFMVGLFVWEDVLRIFSP